MLRAAALASTWLCLNACSDTARIQPPDNELGFVELAEREYWLAGVAQRASATRLFYALQVADTAPLNAPLFVVGGGGPAASAFYLWAYHAPYALDPSDAEEPASNPASLTRMGNVLYLDAANAGFSYPLLTDATTRSRRDAEFSVKNYNLYRDAGDLLRALARLSARHPEWLQNPIYWVTESYGAARASVVSNVLTHRERYASVADAYYEPELTEGATGEVLERFASKLRGQILLQPWFAGARQALVAGELFEQRPSVLDTLADEAGVRYERCPSPSADCDAFQHAQEFLRSIDRSAYDSRLSPGQWESGAAPVTRAATHRMPLQRLLGVKLTELDAVLSAPRKEAYRFADAGQSLFVPRGDLDDFYGQPAIWDAFFVPLNVEAQAAFVAADTRAAAADPEREQIGELLLDNIRTVPTFMSRASYDLLIYGPALPKVLQGYTGVASVELVLAEPLDELRITFSDGTLGLVYSKEYESSHAVSRDAALALSQDLERFVARTRH